MTRLVLEGCPLVTDRTMEVLKVKLYRLTHLNIKVCRITLTQSRETLRKVLRASDSFLLCNRAVIPSPMWASVWR